MSTIRVLIVEDDRRLAEVLHDGLEEEGMTVDVAAGGEEALRLTATKPQYDVVVLDVLLGAGIDGFEVCRRLRESHCPAAVLMLTALDAVANRVRGLNAGADDYLVKPFAFDELVARCHALMRRHAGTGPAPAGITLDPRSRRVFVDGAELTMPRKEFDILELLLRRPGQVVSKEQMLHAVWPDDAEIGANHVEVHIARIRRKLHQAGSRSSITTIRHVGYRMETPQVAA